MNVVLCRDRVVSDECMGCDRLDCSVQVDVGGVASRHSGSSGIRAPKLIGLYIGAGIECCDDKPLHLFLNSEAEICLNNYLYWLVANKPEDFANGRDVRNIFEFVWQTRSNRLVELQKLSDDELNEIRKEDFQDWVISPSHKKF